MNRFAVFALVLLVLQAACLQADEPQKLTFRHSGDSVQHIYLDGVPHLDRDGQKCMAYDPAKFVFPRILYHPRLTLDKAGKLPTDFAAIEAAGYNMIETTAKLSNELLDESEKHNLRIIKCFARPDDAKNFGQHPALYAWDVIDEPDHDGRFSAYPHRFKIYREFRDGIRKYDPKRPIFVNNVAWILPPNLPWWVKWQKIGDIACHDNYPIEHPQGTPPRPSLSFNIGIPETVSLAVSVTDQKKPVWMIAQAFTDQRDGKGRWPLPTPTELRAMVYTALIHGATGISIFSYDNWVTRDANILGISPAPLASYDPNEKKHRVATEEELQAMRELWDQAARINNEIKTLTPWLYSPTSKAELKVQIAGESKTPAPIRVLIKKYGGEYRILAANIDRAPIQVKFLWPGRNVRVEKIFFDGDGAVSVKEGKTDTHWTDSFPPLGVQVYSVRPSGK